MRTVLLIDDEADILTVGALSLERIGGMRVLTASNGVDGAAIAAREKPDIVVVDLMMPGVDGIATLEALRVDPETSGIPVVLMTARHQRRELEGFLARGFASVITKPFDPLTLPKQLEGIHERAVAASRDLEAALDELRAEYRAALPQRVAELRGAVMAFERDPRTESRRALAERLAHKLRGTAGSLGFSVVSELAGKLEDLLGRALDPPRSTDLPALCRRARLLAHRLAVASGLDAPS